MPPYGSSSRYAIKDRGSYYDRRPGRAAPSAAARAAAVSRRRIPAARRTTRVLKETGFVDMGTLGYDFDSTGQIDLLNTVPQGASTSQRIGKRITLKSLQCRGYVRNNTAAVFNHGALMIVYDKRPDGTVPAITDILIQPISSAFNNTQNEGRFSILKRTDLVLNGNTQVTGAGLEEQTSNTAVDMCFYLDLKGLPTVYKQAGTGGIGDIEQGALYVVTVGMNGVGTSAAVGSMNFRLRYNDV